MILLWVIPNQIQNFKWLLVSGNGNIDEFPDKRPYKLYGIIQCIPFNKLFFPSKKKDECGDIE